MYGNLKDFLINFHSNDPISSLSSPTSTPEELASESSRCGSSSSFPLAYAALRRKLPLSQQDSVFSTRSAGSTSKDCLPGSSRSSSRSGNYCPGENNGASFSSNCGDSGIEEEHNCFLDLEILQNIALQIAQGLQHLSSLNVSFDPVFGPFFFFPFFLLIFFNC